MHYKVEEALRQAKEWPPRYYWMGGIFFVLLVVGIIRLWPESKPKPDPTVEAAIAAMKKDQEANQPPPPIEPSTPPIPHRKAIQVK